MHIRICNAHNVCQLAESKAVYQETVRLSISITYLRTQAARSKSTTSWRGQIVESWRQHHKRCPAIIIIIFFYPR